MSDLLEVFVPTFNRIDYLRECLLSILNQTFRDFRLIVLDNASGQDVAGMLREVGDDRIKLIRNSSNIGGVANIQKAFDLASAEFVMVFHDDDCMHPQLLKRQLQLFRENPALSFVFTSVHLVFEDSAMLDFPAESAFMVEYFHSADELIDAALFRGRVFGFGSVMYRTSIAKRLRLNTDRFANICDRPYLVALATLGPCARLIGPAYNVRVHPDQDSTSGCWDYLNEIEVARYYLDVSRRTELGPLRGQVMKMLVQCYAVRRPRVGLIMWLRALESKGLLYWTPLVKYLPFYLLRSSIVRLLKSLSPTLVQQYTQRRLRRGDKLAVRPSRTASHLIISSASEGSGEDHV